VVSNNKEFQVYLDTFDEPSKHRDLLWDAWVEATRVAEEKFTSTNKQSMPFCTSCKSERVTVVCNDCGFKHCM